MRRDGSTAKSLILLLRIALGKEEVSALPNDVYWEEVYDLSLRQSVGAIACDGMLTMEDCNIDEVLKYKWMGQGMVIEQKSVAQWKLLCQLSDLYAQNGIKMNVLKGFSFASYYPNPFHRASTDLDICLLEDFERGNQLVEKTGIKVDRNDSKHSHFSIHGIHVENHQFCVGVRGNKINKDIERYLRGFLEREGSLLDGSNAFKPIWLFNAVFFMCHARHHLLVEEGITLKHVCDWILLRGSEEAKINISSFWVDCERLGLSKFAKSIDEVASYVETGGTLSDSGSKLLEDILSTKVHNGSKNRELAHLNMLRMMWKNRWKYKKYSNMTSIGMMGMYVYGYLFDRNPKV